MWKGLREFLTYNKKQRNGLLVLATLALLIQLFLYFDDYLFHTPKTDFTQFEAAVAEWQLRDSLEQFSAREEISFFPFDPNTASKEELVELGLSARQISTLHNYRSKGGEFRKPSDLQKIYGIDSAWYEQAKPYIDIPSNEAKQEFHDRYSLKPTPFNINKISQPGLVKMGLRDWQARRIITYREKVKPYETPDELYKVYGMDSGIVDKLIPFIEIDSADIEVSPEAEERKLVVVEINTADSLALLKLPGVGPAYAKRIKQYRDRLGGFHSKAQLLEVYGMDEERLAGFEQWITVDKNQLRKLDLNKATFKELLHHPYLEYEMVKSIVNFREHTRPFKSVDELKHLEGLNEGVVEKLKPYLEIR